MIGLLSLLLGILLSLGVVGVHLGSFIGLFLQVFLALALGTPGCRLLGSLYARLLPAFPCFLV